MRKFGEYSNERFVQQRRFFQALGKEPGIVSDLIQSLSLSFASLTSESYGVLAYPRCIITPDYINHSPLFCAHGEARPLNEEESRFVDAVWAWAERMNIGKHLWKPEGNMLVLWATGRCFFTSHPDASLRPTADLDLGCSELALRNQEGCWQMVRLPPFVIFIDGHDADLRIKSRAALEEKFRTEFETHLKDYLDAEERELEKLGYTRMSQIASNNKYADKDMHWLVRKQVQGQSIYRIAKDHRVDRGTVRAAIRSAAQKIGLTLTEQS